MVAYLRRHHIGLLALFIALGGTSYAAAKLPRNSVGTAQIKSGAVNESKLAQGVRDKLGRTVQGSPGAAGPTGDAGRDRRRRAREGRHARGAKGDTGAAQGRRRGRRATRARRGARDGGVNTGGVGGTNINITRSARDPRGTSVTLDAARQGARVHHGHVLRALHVGGRLRDREIGASVGGTRSRAPSRRSAATTGVNTEQTINSAGILTNVAGRDAHGVAHEPGHRALQRQRQQGRPADRRDRTRWADARVRS